MECVPPDVEVTMPTTLSSERPFQVVPATTTSSLSVPSMLLQELSQDHNSFGQGIKVDGANTIYQQGLSANLLEAISCVALPIKEVTSIATKKSVATIVKKLKAAAGGGRRYQDNLMHRSALLRFVMFRLVSLYQTLSLFPSLLSLPPSLLLPAYAHTYIPTAIIFVIIFVSGFADCQ